MTRKLKGLTVIAAGLPALISSPAALAATSPSLGTAGGYSIVAGDTVSNTGSSSIAKDVGISPGLDSAPHVTGFGSVSLLGTLHDADSAAAQAMTDTQAAYTALDQTCTDTTVGTKELGGLTLTPGVYCASTIHLSGQLILSGTANDVWIFKATNNIMTSPSSAVVFASGGSAANVWWRAGSLVDIGASTAFIGNILTDANISLLGNASLNGRALSTAGAVRLDSNSVQTPDPPAAPPTTPTQNPTAVLAATSTPGFPNSGFPPATADSQWPAMMLQLGLPLLLATAAIGPRIWRSIKQ